MLLLLTYLLISPSTRGCIFTSDWTWRLKSFFLHAFKHWSVVGQPAFRLSVLSTSLLRLCIHHQLHPCACVGCVSVFLCMVWKDFKKLFSIMNLLIWRWIFRPQSIDMCFLLKFCKIIFCFLKIKMNVHRQKLYHKSRIFSSAMNWTCDNTTNSWREINWKVYVSFHIDFCWYS